MLMLDSPDFLQKNILHIETAAEILIIHKLRIEAAILPLKTLYLLLSYSCADAAGSFPNFLNIHLFFLYLVILTNNRSHFWLI